jgi:hypothetical protein
MSTQCYVLLKRAIENDRIDALVREVMRVPRSIDAVVALWFRFFESLKVSWRDGKGILVLAAHDIRVGVNRLTMTLQVGEGWGVSSRGHL